MTAKTSDIILERLMSLHPKIIDLKLDRMERILASLGHPERALPPVIHIAGTNGKGSTLAMIRAGMESCGRRVHCYTSPHLARFHERIRLAGTLIEESHLAQVLEECETANGGAPITYFEITTAAALLAFAREPADYTLLEVGLGGRLDATNVMTPALSIITPVSIDHQQFLGETVREIAFEKAGILKPGVTAIIGRQDGAALDVITRRADEVGAPLLIAGRDWDVHEQHGRLVYQDEAGLLDLPHPRLIGAHQVDNAGMVVAAMRAIGFGEDACAAAMTDAEWPARMQHLRHGPLVDMVGPDGELWLDGGHNAAAGIAVAEALGRLPKRPVHAICGMLRTKDATGFMTPLASIVDSLHAVSIPGEAATFDAEETASFAAACGIHARSASSVEAAIEDILRDDPASRILICGSLYLAGRVLRDNG